MKSSRFALVLFPALMLFSSEVSAQKKNCEDQNYVTLTGTIQSVGVLPNAPKRREIKVKNSRPCIVDSVLMDRDFPKTCTVGKQFRAYGQMWDYYKSFDLEANKIECF